MAKEAKSGRRLTRSEARSARRAKRRTKKRLLRWVYMGGGGSIAVLLILSLFAGNLPFSFGGGGGSDGPGERVSIQGDAHIAEGQPHDAYNSRPATSGWHYENDAAWGTYSNPLPDETLVHSLEHGGVGIHYNCPEGCEELVQQLEDIAGGYPSGVTLSPYPDMETTIALTAWGWIDKFDEFDQSRILAFIRAHIDQGPETGFITR